MRPMYRSGQEIFVDPGVFVASPTLHPCTVPCVVLHDGADQVYISRISTGDTLYVFKSRTSATKEEG